MMVLAGPFVIPAPSFIIPAPSFIMPDGSFVIPAKAGIQCFRIHLDALDPRLRGDDGKNRGNDGENGEIGGMTRVLTTLWSVPAQLSSYPPHRRKWEVVHAGATPRKQGGAQCSGLGKWLMKKGKMGVVHRRAVSLSSYY
jgi:hypothetical protein